jgi:hypothetical protein
MTGNKQEEAVCGMDRMLLSICLYVYPKTQADEIAMFIYKNGGTRVYSRSQILTRLLELKLTGKQASTEAYQAFTPINLLRAELFWSSPPPLGVVRVSQAKLIDVDECGISFEQCNRSKGHSLVGVRIRKPGHYTRGTKLTIIMAVEPGNPTLPPDVDGSIERPRRWIWV